MWLWCFLCVIGFILWTIKEEDVVDDPKNVKPEWFHEFEKKVLRWRITVLVLMILGGWYARGWFGSEFKILDDRITSVENRITSVHESYLRQDKELCERLLAIEDGLKIDTAKGKEQLESIKEELKIINFKRKALASGIVNQDVITGIVESSELDTAKIRLKQPHGETMDYVFSSNTKVLIMKGNTRIEGSRKDITFGKAILLMPVSKEGFQEASLIVLPSNEK